MTKEELKKLLPDVIVENLSDEKLAKLGKEFERLVEAKVDERTQVAVKCAETQFNEEANLKLQKLVVQIDEAHKKAFSRAVDAICESYEKQLSRMRRGYKGKIRRDSAKFQRRLVECVGEFIDAKVDALLPTKVVREAVHNITAMETLRSMRQILNVNKATALEEVRQPITEAAQYIKKQAVRNRKLRTQNQQLKQKLSQITAEQYLNESIASWPADAKNFAKKVFKNATVEYIKENLSHVLAQYRKNVEITRNTLLEKTLASHYRKKSNVNNISRRSLVESTPPPTIHRTAHTTPEQDEIRGIINTFT